MKMRVLLVLALTSVTQAVAMEGKQGMVVVYEEDFYCSSQAPTPKFSKIKEDLSQFPSLAQQLKVVAALLHECPTAREERVITEHAEMLQERLLYNTQGIREKLKLEQALRKADIATGNPQEAKNTDKIIVRIKEQLATVEKLDIQLNDSYPALQRFCKQCHPYGPVFNQAITQ